MTDTNSGAPASGNFLDEEQQVVLQNIAKLGTERTKGRAIALLTLNKGATRAEAGEASGLTLGQIKYVLATFRQRGLDMFDRYSFTEAVEEVAPPKEVVERKKAKKGKKKTGKKEEPKGKKMAKNGKKQKKDKKVKAKDKGKKKGKGGKKKGKKK